MEVDIASIASQVVWLAFFLGAAFGAIAQRSQFCTMGAVADIVSMGDWDRMRQWLLAIAVAILGTNLLAYAGYIDLSKAIYTAPRLTWLSHIVGGALFGFGMVMTSGCGSKTLVRIGGGNLKSLIVFIVIGLSAFMTLKGVLALPRVNLLEPVSMTLATNQDLPSILAPLLGDKHVLQLLVPAVITLVLLIFVLMSPSFRSLENILTGLGVGLIIVAAWFVSGKLGYVAEDPNTLQEAYVATNSGKMESFSFVAPFAYTIDLLIFWTDKSKAVSFGIAATLGMIVGSFAYAISAGKFRFEGFGGVSDVSNHLIGAMLMGFGGVTALGCTVGQGLSGISTLAVGSMITFASIIGGCVLSLKYQAYRLEKIDAAAAFKACGP
ncbi:YeeE/YedE family protein [Undibacterium terreum]|uniref:Membrane protein n=1 Tax=Undibacterium terreum TaxID=1224302 RepID=A0A916UGK5_9BURK|nr:YeeE/YedE family protein [Undibacterium terreum]GGC71096.1 membrane protein [Undibacterium terreum]